MEKLIKAINEYGKTSNCGPFETCRIEPATEWNSSYLVLSRDDNGEGDWKNWMVSIPRLISKEYGFIKWLVENDKIDRVQKTKEFRLQIELDNGSYGELGGEARLLMLLSISDTPIEDLISYLK